MKRLEFSENGLNLVLEITESNEVKLLHFSALPFEEASLAPRGADDGFRLAEVQLTGLDRTGERHGYKGVRTSPGYDLKYREIKDYRNETGRKLEIVTEDKHTAISVCSHFQFFDGIPVVRAWTDVTNTGGTEQGLEYVASFTLSGIEKEGMQEYDDKLELRIPHNSWQRELHWNTYSLPDLGLSRSQPAAKMHSSKLVEATNTGNWSAKQYLPMGYLQNKETQSALFWQIEHNGSWHWEISDHDGHLYLALSGPNETNSQWWKRLQPGETFTSVPVSVGSVLGGFDEAMGELTRYRRAIRRKNTDNERLAVIFNDYMNCLWGDPTTAKELPLIDAAAETGCEYFCVDCGWYSDGIWWDNVGEWLPAKGRFPGGLMEVMDYIRSKGLVPGVWLEIEVMGTKCPLADKVPDDWFFQRHGKRIFDRSRYQLDFRNPEVREFATGVIDRLVNDYHVGYIKMDYNIEPGMGTEVNADSCGDGLLGHNRAYLGWLDSIFASYPELIIENCSSGGLRMDYAMLSRYSIQSTSDQEDYQRYATIAANAPSGLTPEQSAIWSYPLSEGDDEEVIFNMVNAMLMRIHQSGHLAQIAPERRALVKEALDYYKTIRGDIKNALPFWPLGLSKYSDPWVSMGLKTETDTHLAVWRRESHDPVCTIPVPHLKGKEVQVACGYPSKAPCEYAWNREAGTLTVRLPNPVSARLFHLSAK